MNDCQLHLLCHHINIAPLETIISQNEGRRRGTKIDNPSKLNCWEAIYLGWHRLSSDSTSAFVDTRTWFSLSFSFVLIERFNWCRAYQRSYSQQLTVERMRVDSWMSPMKLNTSTSSSRHEIVDALGNSIGLLVGFELFWVSYVWREVC